MYEIFDGIIKVGSVMAAIGLLLGVIVKIVLWFQNQRKQDDEITKIKKHHDDDVHRLKEELCLICYALSACLDGLQQLGCNHTVPDAKKKVDKFLNQQAHE